MYRLKQLASHVKPSACHSQGAVHVAIFQYQNSNKEWMVEAKTRWWWPWSQLAIAVWYQAIQLTMDLCFTSPIYINLHHFAEATFVRLWLMATLMAAARVLIWNQRPRKILAWQHVFLLSPILFFNLPKQGKQFISQLQANNASCYIWGKVKVQLLTSRPELFKNLRPKAID